MGFLQRISSVSSPARIKASLSQDYANAFWAGDSLPSAWMSSLGSAGIAVSPEAAMTLSGFASGVRIISYDLATVPCHVLKYLDGGGKERVRPFYGDGIDTSGGIRSLSYMLSEQPNNMQSAPEWLMGMVAMFLLRSRAFSEIISGPTGFMEQLLPRHPDRVTVERLPNGRPRYKLIEANGQPRYVTADEMFVVTDISLDGGMSVLGRVAYGGASISAALFAQQAASKFWKSGMTAAKVATYTGDMDPEDEAALHASISRFASGVDNSFGLALVPDNITISNLGIDPDKAQLLQNQEWGIKEAARLLNISPRKLGIETSISTGSSLEEENAQHATNCLRPIAVLFEKAIKRDLILRKDTFFAEFLLDALYRGNAATRAAYYTAAIEAPWMWPSEVRVKENMNPDEELDKLAEVRYRPGTPRNSPDGEAEPFPAKTPPQNSKAQLRAFRAVQDNAERCVRREKAVVSKLAVKHANDPAAWQAGLQDFLAEHAGFVAQTMRVPLTLAREYAAQHGAVLSVEGLPAWTEHFEREQSDVLAELALEGAAA